MVIISAGKQDGLLRTILRKSWPKVVKEGQMCVGRLWTSLRSDSSTSQQAPGSEFTGQPRSAARNY